MRSSVVRGLVWLVSLCITGAAQASPFAYIANSYSDSVWVIDTANNGVHAIVRVGGGPYGVAVQPDGDHVYVTNQADNSVSVIDATTNTVSVTIPLLRGVQSASARDLTSGHCGGMTLPTLTPRPTPTATPKRVGIAPLGVALNAVGSTAYVTTIGGLSIIDTITNAVRNTIPIPTALDALSRPQGISVDPGRRRIYVTVDNGFQQTGSVAVIDAGTELVMQMVPVGEGPLGLAVAPNGTHVYVANSRDDSVSVIDTATYEATRVHVGRAPAAVAASPNGDQVYVTNQGDADTAGSVSIIDTATASVAATVQAGVSPFGLSFDQDGKRVFVVNAGSDNVSVIDATSATVVATIGAGASPRSLGSFIGPVRPVIGSPTPTPTGAPVTEVAFVANSAGKDISVIDTASNRVIKTVSLDANPEAIAVNATATRVYAILDSTLGSGSLAVINPEAEQTVATLTLDNGPQDLVMTPDGGTVYVAGYQAVSVIDTTNNSVVARLGDSSSFVGEGHIAVSPDGTLVYVTVADTVQGMARILIIDTRTRAIVDSFLAEAAYGSFAIAPNGLTAYAVDSSLNAHVDVIDLKQRRVTKHLYLQAGVASVQATGFAVSPRDPFAYIVADLFIPWEPPALFCGTLRSRYDKQDGHRTLRARGEESGRHHVCAPRRGGVPDRSERQYGCGPRLGPACTADTHSRR